MSSLQRAFFIPALLAFASTDVMADTGRLTIYGNGEDLATQGFQGEKLTVDGWSLTFDHIFVTVSQITAHQVSQPYDAHTGGDFHSFTSAPSLSGPVTLDLVDADADDRVLIDTLSATAGHYNALEWSIVPATEGEWTGYSMVFVGTAVRDNERVDFTLASTDAVKHRCGEYVGDERKGFLNADGTAEQELTFHLDHIFGRSDKATNDPMNQSALGFDPFADGGTQMLSLEGLHIGHAGEGHCAIIRL